MAGAAEHIVKPRSKAGRALTAVPRGVRTAWRLTSAIMAIRKREFGDIKSLVDFVFDGRGWYIKPIQVRSEITSMLELVAQRRPRHVLEVGTATGGTFFFLTRVAARDAHLISLDLPGGEFDGGYPVRRLPLYRSFALPGQRLDFIRADSHSAPTLDSVRALLDGNLLDFLFIDADHTYEGVKRDFEMYGGLVRPGGMIGFHDISRNPDPCYGVHRFWNEIKGGYEHREFMQFPNKHYGIGVLLLANDATPAATPT